MIKCSEILEELNRIAPLELQESWDNCGLLVGDKEKFITKILFSLEVNSEVIREAASLGCDMIISHHPIMLKPINKITPDDVYGNMVINLIKNDINLCSMHTNLDKADGGINDKLAELFVLNDVGVLDEKTGLGRIGVLDETVTLYEFVENVSDVLQMKPIKFVGDENKEIRTVAVLSGAGADFAEVALNEGADVLVTSEVKQHIAQFCYEKGIAIIDAGHFETEDIIMEDLIEALAATFDVPMLKSSQTTYFKTLGDE